MSREPYLYPGGELDVFAHARNWKRYWVSRLPPLAGDILEVGAGLASNTPLMLGPGVRSWTCLEPDHGLVERLRAAIAANPALARCRALEGTVSTLDPALHVDGIVYIDVLEHIEDDRGELLAAAAHLRPGGHLVVLAPAFPFVFSPFDEAVGHFRRYTAASLAAVMPAAFERRLLVYADAVGLLLSMANRMMLRQDRPKKSQIVFWDRVVVPLSRTVVDPLLRSFFGRSVIGAWRRPG
jgi:SAM-dependent methyltransferase